ncbi:MAG: trypsin-like peptidase domain-containing protein [Nanoarchaeota archaeon]|nr:trypsin-like peptidase domain-containing protein [Nanoarchaeota archaeon]
MPLKKHHKWMIGSFTTLVIIFMITTGILLNAIIVNQALNHNEISNRVTNLQLESQSKFNDLTSSVIKLEKSFNLIEQDLYETQGILEQNQQELNELKASVDDDFSGIIENAIESVVTIVTDISQGTGFLIEESGYVVTNAHVMENARSAGIYTYDGEMHQVSLIGTNSEMDVCLLKIQGTYPALKLGNSDDVSIGESVIAIGNPLGLQFSVTEGIISAIHREGANGLKAYFQTDAALNPGNSGGPLVDKQGKAIGINNFKTSEGESLGFALESNWLKDVVNEIYFEKEGGMLV